jgi:hypothetical protein
MPIHRGVLAAYSRQSTPKRAANAASSSLAARFNATANAPVRAARRGSAKSRVQPVQMTTSDTYIGLRLKRYGPARRRYSGASVATLSRRSGAASKCWARDQAAPAVPATRHPTPARRAAPRGWAPARCDRRASATGRSACAARKPALQTSTTTSLGSLRLVLRSVVSPDLCPTSVDGQAMFHLHSRRQLAPQESRRASRARA